MFNIHAVNTDTSPTIVTMKINGHAVEMEVDTGAAVSVITKQVWNALPVTTPIQKTRVILKTYTSEKIKVIGKSNMTVGYNGKENNLEVYIVENHGPCLVGRDWLQHIPINWKCINFINDGTELKKLLDKYGTVFSDKVGTQLHLKDGVTPRYHRPRAVPFALKEAVEEEIERLVAEGILEKVTSSEWAAPIAVVPKKDGKFRICGDYKVTINPVLDIDIHPLPKLEELFATLAGGKRFSKIDLSQAYQQLRVENSSKRLLTINTHKGLLIHKASLRGCISTCDFSKTILQGIPRVTCYLDDILVTGEDDAAHLANLEEVLRRLVEHGITIKKSKCSFLCKSVEYLGHVVDCEGLHTTPEKTEAIVGAPAPKNVQELQSFLGLLNYYSKFIPDLATVLNPLNKLLKHQVKWQWSKECEIAMKEAKKRLIASRVLVHYDPSLKDIYYRVPWNKTTWKCRLAFQVTYARVTM